MKPLTTFILALLLMASWPSWSQAAQSEKLCTIKGTVLDDQNKPLPFANVFLKGRMEGSISDNDGNFSFKTNALGKVTLLCSFIGYASFEKELDLRAGSTIEVKIKLRQTEIKGKSVMVTASAFTAADEEGVTLTAMDVVRTRGAAADLFWAIKTFPGLQQVDEGAGLFVRGGDVSETVVLLDGAIINHPYKYESPTGGFFGTFSPFLLKGTFFSSGGFSAQYGNALSGALAMESQDMPDRRMMGFGLGLGMIQCFFVTGLFYTVIYHRNLKQKEVEQAELKILTRDAELKALKLQMNPHFLFNSLNSINALITQQPTLARKMISQLSELLRMSLESHDKLMIPLQEELELVHTYLSIEQIRFGDKMVVNEDIDPELMTTPFPAMLLQPLLENAVKHGITNTRTGGTISLSIQKAGGFVVGRVVNESEDLNLATAASSAGNGRSLQNIRQRLDRMYGNDYVWIIDRSEPNKFKVEFRLPLSV